MFLKMLFPLLLIPIIVSGDFLKQSLSDNQLETAIAINGGSWSNSEGIIYTYEVPNAQQAAYIKGIVLSTDFSSEEPTQGKMMKTTITVSNSNQQVFVFPFRNMQQITCNTGGWSNYLTFYANQTNYDLYMDLWGSDCNTLAGEFETMRVARQSTLSQAVQSLSNYANTYITARQQVANLSGLIGSVDSSIASENAAIQTTQLTISALQTQTLQTQAQIAAVNQNITQLQTTVQGLNTRISQDKTQIAGYQTSVQNLTAQNASDVSAKAIYDTNAGNAFALVQKFLQQLISELPTSKSLQGLDSSLKSNLDLNAFNSVLRSVLPVTTI